MQEPMKPQKKYFPGQEETEKVLDVIRRHWFSYTIFVFFAVAMLVPVVIALIYGVSNSENISAGWVNIGIIALSIYTLSIFGLLIFGFTDYYLDVYILTDHRIVDIAQNGFFKRKISELNVRQIQDVNAEVNGLFATIFHFGDVYIQTAGERENFVFRSVPHPYRTTKKILELHEAYLRRKGLKQKEINQEKAPEDEQFIEPETVDSQEFKEINDKRQKTIIDGITNTIKEEGKLEEDKEIDL